MLPSAVSISSNSLLYYTLIFSFALFRTTSSAYKSMFRCHKNTQRVVCVCVVCVFVCVVCVFVCVCGVCLCVWCVFVCVCVCVYVCECVVCVYVCVFVASWQRKKL